MTRLALTGISLSHFRSHKTCSLTFDNRPVAIFGANGAGKTNILEAISLLSPGRGLRRAPPEHLARTPETVGWKVRATLDSLNQTHEIETSALPGESRSVRIDGKPAPQLALGRILRMVWLVPVMDRLWVEGATERRRFLDRITMSFEPGHAETSLAYEKSMRERNRLLKDQVQDASWYQAIETQMATAGAKIITNRRFAITRLHEAQNDARTVFPRADLTIISNDDTPPDHTEASLLDALSTNRNRDMAAGRTLTGPHRADLHAIYSAKGVEARQCSTGEQKALLISLILANARALAVDFGAPPILLLDEIAAHLDEARRMSLFDEICALGAQAFMTGTGRSLFDGFATRARYIEVVEENGLSQTAEVTP